jgi:hypothetical protein
MLLRKMGNGNAMPYLVSFLDLIQLLLSIDVCGALVFLSKLYAACDPAMTPSWRALSALSYEKTTVEERYINEVVFFRQCRKEKRRSSRFCWIGYVLLSNSIVYFPRFRQCSSEQRLSGGRALPRWGDMH